MPDAPLPPWATGPGEILRHGLALIREDSDTNRRLAMIAVDNAVELMIKTFLGLPKRVTGLHISRKQYAEIAESFPALLDAIEQHAADKVAGINLGEIEWYHRLRNELYHQGNGLTVERDKVEVYAQLANVLFKSLFGIALVLPPTRSDRLLGEFFELWIELEKDLVSLAHDNSLTGAHGANLSQAAKLLEGTGFVSEADIKEFQELRQLRNMLVHGVTDHSRVLTPAIIARVRALRNRFAAEE